MVARKLESKARVRTTPSRLISEQSTTFLRSEQAKKNVKEEAKKNVKDSASMSDKKRKTKEESPEPTPRPSKRVKVEKVQSKAPVPADGTKKVISKKKKTSPSPVKSTVKSRNVATKKTEIPPDKSRTTVPKKAEAPKKTETPSASGKAEKVTAKKTVMKTREVAARKSLPRKAPAAAKPAAAKDSGKKPANPASRKSPRAAPAAAKKIVKPSVPVAKKLPKPSPIKKGTGAKLAVRPVPITPTKSRAKSATPSKGIQKKRKSTPEIKAKRSRVSSKPTTAAPRKPTAPPVNTKPARSDIDLTGYSYGEPIGDATGKLDLVFCLDCTGSMSSVIRACQDSIVSLAESLTRAEGQDVRFCLIPYRDHAASEEFCTRVYPFTRDVKQMQANVNAQSANGGGDTPEAVTAAMYEAACLDWRDDAAKLVVFMADAGPHGLGEGYTFPEGDPDGKDPLVLAREMQGMGICVYSLVSGGTPRTRHFFAALAAMTGAQSIDLANVALLGDAILGGAREGLDMEARMGAVRARLAAAAERRGAPLTEEEAAEEARAAMDEAGGSGADGAALRPRVIAEDQVITIPAERLEQARQAASIVELRRLWSDGAEPAAAAAAAPLGGEEGLVRRVAAMAAAREARPKGKVLIECVSDGKKVRARVASDGYDGSKNCQFPRDIRTEGRRFWADGVVDAGSFYRVTGKIVPADE